MGQFIDFRHVKQHADFLPVLARYGVELEGTGDERKALCPFHDENDASFKVNLKKGRSTASAAVSTATCSTS